MKTKILFIFSALLAALLCGCALTEASRNIENSKKLRVGMTKTQVLAVMGKPVEEEFATPDLWFYFVKSVWMDGLTTEEECLPLVFEKGKLIGWGNRFYNDHQARLIDQRYSVPVDSADSAKKGK